MTGMYAAVIGMLLCFATHLAREAGHGTARRSASSQLPRRYP